MAEKQISGLQVGSAYGPYQLIRILGEGGGGQVWEADDSRNGRRVALKVMTELEADSPNALERFEREGRLAASITHPSCVLVFGAEEVESRPTISMELMRGGTLRDRLSEGPLEYSEAVEHVLGMIEGLEAAQAAGIIHRDVKPSNCFLEEGGTRSKIGDFGVSRTLEVPTDLTATGTFIGTPSYASPEQVRRARRRSRRAPSTVDGRATDAEPRRDRARRGARSPPPPPGSGRGSRTPRARRDARRPGP